MMIERPASLHFVEIIDLPAMLLRRPLRRLYPIAFFGLVVAGAPALLFSVLAGMAGTPDAGLIAVTMLAAVWAGLAGAATQLAIYAGVRDVLDGREPGFRRAWREALKISRLATLVLLGLVTLVGFCLCVLPGLVFAVMLSLVVPVLIDEPRRGANALARSWELVGYQPPGSRGLWIQVVGVLLVGLLLGWALQSIAQVPSLAYQVIHNIRQAAGGQLPAGTPTGIGVLQAITGVVAWAFGALGEIYKAGMMMLMFRKAREVREAPGLERAFASLASARPPSPSTGR